VVCLIEILRNSNEPPVDESAHGSSDSDDLPPLQGGLGPTGMVHNGLPLPAHLMNPLANGLLAHPHGHPLALVGPAAVANLQHALPPGVGRVSSRFTKEEVAYLKEQRDKYGVTHMASSLFDRMRIANFLAVPLQKVNNWFQNNRVRNIDPGDGTHSDHDMVKAEDPAS